MSDRQDNRIPEPEELASLLNALASLPAEDVDEPRPEQAAARRAARSGKSIDEVLFEDRARLRQSRYPGPECYQPYEVEQYFLGSLKPERMAHTNTCAACSVLVQAAMPDAARAESIVEEVREMAEAISRATAAEPVAVRQPLVPWWRRWRSRRIWKPTSGFTLEFGPALGFLAATLSVLVAVSGVSLVYRLALPFPEAPEVARAVAAISLQPALTALTAALAVAVLVAWLVPRFRWAGVLASRRAVAVAGLVLAVVAARYTWWDLGQRARQTQLGLSLVSDHLTQVVAESLNVRRSAGTFPLIEYDGGSVVLATALRDPDRAVYRARANGLKGDVVAHLWRDGGAVYWNRDGKSERVATLVLGTVDAVTPDTIVLHERQGTKLTIKVPPDLTRRRGEEVVAIIDQRTNTAASVYRVGSVTAITQ